MMPIAQANGPEAVVLEQEIGYRMLFVSRSSLDVRLDEAFESLGVP